MHIVAFNVDPQFAANFEFQKSSTDARAGLHEIKYLEASFDRETDYGEFFMGFEDSVSNKKLKARFAALGAGSVWVTTFAQNDNNESTSSALASVRKLAAKTSSVPYVRHGGSLPESINKRANEKLAEAEELKQTQKEFDEKTNL